jgi:hypothetical protein
LALARSVFTDRLCFHNLLRRCAGLKTPAKLLMQAEILCRFDGHRPAGATSSRSRPEERLWELESPLTFAAHRGRMTSYTEVISGEKPALGKRTKLASVSRQVIYSAIAANIAITIYKFVAAGFTRRSAMLREAVRSTADARK